MTCDEYDEIVTGLMDLHRPDRYTLDADGRAPWMANVTAAMVEIAAENPAFDAHLLGRASE